MKRILALVLIGTMFGTASLYAAPPMMNLTLEDAEKKATQQSHFLKVKILEMEASRAKADSQMSLLWPRLSLEGNLQYTAELAELELSLPMNQTMNLELGDHTAYNIGAVAAWNIWDSGRVYYSWRALEHVAKAKEEELEMIRQDVVLKTRLAYFKTQMSLEQVRVLKSALTVVKAQYRDIKVKNNAGTSSKLDVLSSHLDVLARSRALKRANMDLSDTIRDLLNLIGGVEDYDITYPMEVEHARQAIKSKKPPTLLISFDPLSKSMKTLLAAEKQLLNENHSRAKMFSELAKAARRLTLSIESGHWPTIQVMAKSSYEYPNGLVPENVFQNRVGVSLKWPLFQGNQVVKQGQEQAIKAQANEHQLQQAQVDLKLTWLKTKDRMVVLKSEEKTNQLTVNETKALARLMYQTYQAGRIDFVQVQAANLRVLEAETQVLRTQVEMLIQLAMLDGMAENKVRSAHHESQTN